MYTIDRKQKDVQKKYPPKLKTTWEIHHSKEALNNKTVRKKSNIILF